MKNPGVLICVHHTVWIPGLLPLSDPKRNCAIAVTLDVPELSSDELSPIRITASTRDEQHSERLQEHLMERIPVGSAPSEFQPVHDGLPGSNPALAESPGNTVLPEGGLNGNPGIPQAPPDWADDEQDAFRNDPEMSEIKPTPQRGLVGEQISPPDQPASFDPGQEGTQEPSSDMPASFSGSTGAPAQDAGTQ